MYPRCIVLLAMLVVALLGYSMAEEVPLKKAFPQPPPYVCQNPLNLTDPKIVEFLENAAKYFLPLQIVKITSAICKEVPPPPTRYYKAVIEGRTVPDLQTMYCCIEFPYPLGVDPEKYPQQLTCRRSPVSC